MDLLKCLAMELFFSSLIIVVNEPPKILYTALRSAFSTKMNPLLLLHTTITRQFFSWGLASEKTHVTVILQALPFRHFIGQRFGRFFFRLVQD